MPDTPRLTRENRVTPMGTPEGVTPLPWRVGFPDNAIRAECMLRLPDWTPVVDPSAGFAFGGVVALCHDLPTAERIVSLVSENAKLREALTVTASMLTIEATSHEESGDPQRAKYVKPLRGQVASVRALLEAR